LFETAIIDIRSRLWSGCLTYSFIQSRTVLGLLSKPLSELATGLQ